MNKSILSILAVMVLALALWSRPAPEAVTRMDTLPPAAAENTLASPAPSQLANASPDPKSVPAAPGAQDQADLLSLDMPTGEEFSSDSPADAAAAAGQNPESGSLQPEAGAAPSSDNSAGLDVDPSANPSGNPVEAANDTLPSGPDHRSPGNAGNSPLGPEDPTRIRNPYFDGSARAPTARPASAGPARGVAGSPPSGGAQPGASAASSSAASSTVTPRDQNYVRTPAPSASPIAIACPPPEMARAAERLIAANSLGRRGATATAENEFISALVIVAEGRDSVSGGTDCAVELQRALSIVRELEDFFREDTGAATLGNMAQITDLHTSSLVSHSEAVTLSRSDAVTIYRDRIPESFLAACGDNELASDALLGLAKVHSLRAGETPATQDYSNHVTFALYAAAMGCNPRNGRCANELGVWYARQGDFVQAKEMFLRSLRITPTMAGWQNLAKTHSMLGEHQLAESAGKEAALLANQSGSSPASGGGQWVPPEVFGGTPEPGDPLLHGQPNPTPAVQPAEREAKRGGGWPNPFR